MDNPQQTASNFWKNLTTYREEWAKHPHRVDADIIAHFSKYRKIGLKDIGAGPGFIYQWLPPMTIHAIDVNTSFLSPEDISKLGHTLYTYRKDLSKESIVDVPTCDMAVILGVLNFIIDDGIVDVLFSQVHEEMLIVRVACQDGGLIINKDIPGLGNYASNYRPRAVYEQMLRKYYMEVYTTQPWAPFEIDKELAHRQFHFICRRRKHS